MKTKRKQLRRSLQESKTISQVCELPRDNYNANGCWILSDSITVTIAKQKNGLPTSEIVALSKGQFDRLIRGYQFKQRVNIKP